MLLSFYILIIVTIIMLHFVFFSALFTAFCIFITFNV